MSLETRRAARAAQAPDLWTTPTVLALAFDYLKNGEESNDWKKAGPFEPAAALELIMKAREEKNECR